MENASKALLMAAGILIGVLILSLMVTLFLSTKELNNAYEEEKKSVEIQEFNVNFTKYIGQELTIHQVVTICNFAKKEANISVTGGIYNFDSVKDGATSYEQRYSLKIIGYDKNTGKINAIQITKK